MSDDAYPTVADRTNRDNHTIKPDTSTSFGDVYTWRQVLDYAYRQGLTGFSQPSPPVVAQAGDGSPLVIVTTTAHFADGTSTTAVGDAGPSNCGRGVADSFPRMADTRAKARALHDALNLNANLKEEFGDSDGSPRPPQQRSAPARPNNQQVDVSQLPRWEGEDAEYHCDGCGDEIKGSKRNSIQQVIKYSTVGDQLLCYNCRKADKVA